MRSFTLMLIDAGTAEPKRIDFRAYDAVPAFDILEAASIGQAAILWEGDRRVATLRRTNAGAWRLSA